MITNEEVREEDNDQRENEEENEDEGNGDEENGDEENGDEQNEDEESDDEMEEGRIMIIEDLLNMLGMCIPHSSLPCPYISHHFTLLHCYSMYGFLNANLS